MHPIAKRIEKIWTKNYKDLAAFARTLDIDKENLYRLFRPDERSGKYPGVSMLVIEAIARAHSEIDLNWVIRHWEPGDMVEISPNTPMHTQQQEYLEMLTRVLLRIEAAQRELEATQAEVRRIKEMSTPSPPDKHEHARGKHDGNRGDPGGAMVHQQKPKK